MFCHGSVTWNKMELIRPILEIKLVFILSNILIAPENRDNVPIPLKQLSENTDWFSVCNFNFFLFRVFRKKN